MDSGPADLYFSFQNSVLSQACYTFRMHESARVRYGMRDLKIVIGGCARMGRADIHAPPIFCDRMVRRLQKHQVRMRRLCEETRCYPHFYNPLIKQYKDIQMCNNVVCLLFNPIYCACTEPGPTPRGAFKGRAPPNELRCLPLSIPFPSC